MGTNLQKRPIKSLNGHRLHFSFQSTDNEFVITS